MNDFIKTIDRKLLGRNTYGWTLRMGAKFDEQDRYIVFSSEISPI